MASLAHVDGAVTQVEGQTFCLSGRAGDFDPDLPHGLFVLDTRVLSCWQLRVNGHRIFHGHGVRCEVEGERSGAFG